MNKFKQLIRRIGVEGGIIAGILFGVAVVFFITGSMASGAAQKKSNAGSQFAGDQGRMATLKARLETSDESEKRFVEIQLEHANTDYSMDKNELQVWLNEAQGRYRLGDSFKLVVPLPVPTDKPELADVGFDIATRPKMRLEMQAISDLHIFTFMEALRREAPGLVRYTSVKLERKGDLNTESLAALRRSPPPYLVDGVVEFDWIGIAPKVAATPEGGAAPSAAQPGGMP